MISRLSGHVIEKTQKSLVIDVGGVGFLVASPLETLQNIKINETVSLYTYLAVRENALDLYGFNNKDTRDFFILLINISGIGPKTALSILNVANAATIQKAVVAQDISYLTKVSGIGRKTAEKIIHELEDKVGALEEGASISGEVDVVEALRSLGYSQNEARDALQKVPKNIDDTGERVKAALKILGK